MGVLLDENMPKALARAIRQLDRDVVVLRVGDGLAPPLGAPDPDILEFIASYEHVLVTDNRGSMPVHLAQRLAVGGHVPGILQVPDEYQFGELVEAILVCIGASLPGELQNRITHLSELMT